MQKPRFPSRTLHGVNVTYPVMKCVLIKISYPKSDAYNKTPLFIYLCGIIQIPVYIKVNQTDDGFISDSVSQNSTIPFKCYIYANTFLFKEEFL